MPPQNPSYPSPEPETLPPLTGRPIRPALIALLTIGSLLALLMFGGKTGFVRAHLDQGRGTTPCLQNLRQLEGAKQTWALEFKAAQTDTPTWQQLAPYLQSFRNEPPSPPKCPAGGTYTINNNLIAPTCSIPGHTLE